MIKLLFTILVEAIVGISLAGLVLAILVPTLNVVRPAGRGDLTTAVVIGGVIVLVTAGVLLRPGSAIHRWTRR